MLLAFWLSLIALAAMGLACFLAWMRWRQREEDETAFWSSTQGDKGLRLMRPLCSAHVQVLDLLRREIPGVTVLSVVPLTRVLQLGGQPSCMPGHPPKLLDSLCLDFAICSDNGSVRTVIDLVGGPGLEHRGHSRSSRGRRAVMRELLRQAGVEVVCWHAGAMPPAAEVSATLQAAAAACWVDLEV